MKRFVLIAAAVLPQVVVAEQASFKCRLFSTAEVNEFTLKVDEATGKVVHTFDKDSAYEVDGVFADNTIAYQKKDVTSLINITDRYEIDKTSFSLLRTFIVEQADPELAAKTPPSRSTTVGICQKEQQGKSVGLSFDDEMKADQLLNESGRLAFSKTPEEAVPQLEKLISIYEEKYRGEKRKIFASRWGKESLAYVNEADKTQPPPIVLPKTWAYAYYLNAYTLNGLGKVKEAKASLERAIALSPHNAQFLLELGNVYQKEKEWDLAVKTFKSAESAARDFSPPWAMNNELSRAWRGLGYVYVEQNQLDQGEKMYRKCLELNSNDARALNELRYIEKQREKLGGK